MNRTTQTAIVTIIMVTAVMGVCGEIIPDAEAKKGSGVYLPSTGHASDICGLITCSEYPGGREAYQANWSAEYLSGKTVGDDDGHNPIATATPETVDKEFAAALDEHIHKFELDQISAEEALRGIKSVYGDFENHGVMTDIILGVGTKLDLHESSALNTEDAIEAVHLTVKPQNISLEYQITVERVMKKFMRDKLPAEDAIREIKETHDGFTRLHVTSDLIEAVSEKIKLIDSGKLSGADAVDVIYMTVKPHIINLKFIHELSNYYLMLDMDMISVEEAIKGILETNDEFIRLQITSDLTEAVSEKIKLIESGKLSGADAVEAVFLWIEPQRVDGDFAVSISAYIREFERDRLSSQETITKIIDAHQRLVSLHITSEIIGAVGIQIDRYNSDNDSVEQVLNKIHELVDEVEFEFISLKPVERQIPAKELPLHIVDIAVGADINGCQKSNTCYTPTHLTVSVGTAVGWINSDDTVTHILIAGWPGAYEYGDDYFMGNGFVSDTMHGGDIFQHTFNTRGEYYYFCGFHPWMAGSITVE